MKKFKLKNGVEIGQGQPTFIVAEISGNHNQSFERAVQLIEEAKQAGADGVKLQTYTADTLTIDCDAEYFRLKGTLWAGRNLYDLYKEAYTPWDWQPKLMEVANKLGLTFFSTPFDPSSVDFLEEMDIPIYKVASSEMNDLPLLEKIASTQKPVIISTGMATLGEIEDAVGVFRNSGVEEIVLLKCTVAYPSQHSDMNLSTIPHLASTFDVVSGLSDHSLGIEAPVVATALGGKCIEKHLTLDRNDGGPDSAFSLEPKDFSEMVKAVRNAECALGEVRYGSTDSEEEASRFRRSLFVVDDIEAGEKLTEQNVRSIRPGHGLKPMHLPAVLDCKARVDLKKGTPLEWKLIE